MVWRWCCYWWSFVILKNYQISWTVQSQSSWIVKNCQWMYICLTIDEKRSSNICKLEKRLRNLIATKTLGSYTKEYLVCVLLQPIYTGELSEKINHPFLASNSYYEVEKNSLRHAFVFSKLKVLIWHQYQVIHRYENLSCCT